ncbi:shikimate kinase 1 [bacterium BMS3Bbin10]|nr:shikimate kinase 1 [bacterium BMS3Bbin10]HDL17167.1 shikimate kinase [Hyphomicrobiales bacterium]
MPSRAQSRKRADNDARSKAIRANLGERSIVLIGLMGAGKTAIGRRLARQLDLAFVDADTEIERAAGKSISDIFADHGENHFRDGERKVISRLLDGGPQVLATGGGAYMNEQTRKTIAKQGISIWLKAELKILLERVRRRDHRPLLKTGDPKEVMKRLMDERYPVYESADITAVSRDVPHDVIVGEIMDALANCPALAGDGGQKAEG